jgi:hypothetical protein
MKDDTTPSSPIVAIKMAPSQGECIPVQCREVEVIVTVMNDDVNMFVGRTSYIDIEL